MLSQRPPSPGRTALWVEGVAPYTTTLTQVAVQSNAAAQRPPRVFTPVRNFGLISAEYL